MDEEISGTELRDLLEADGEVRVVDIRSPEAYRRGHIQGSENIPFADLADRVAELDGAERVVTVCPHGEASVQAARMISAYEGVDGTVASLSCGVTGWEGDLVADDGDADGSDEAEPDAPF